MDIETGSKGGEGGERQEDGMGWDVNADSAPFPLPWSLPLFLVVAPPLCGDEMGHGADGWGVKIHPTIFAFCCCRRSAWICCILLLISRIQTRPNEQLSKSAEEFHPISTTI